MNHQTRYNRAIQIFRCAMAELDREFGRPAKLRSYQELEELARQVLRDGTDTGAAEVCGIILAGPLPTGTRGGGGDADDGSTATKFGKIIPFRG